MRLFRPFRGRIAVSVAVGLFQVAASLAFVWASKWVVDMATGKSDAPLRNGVLAFVCVLAAQILGRVFSNYWQSLIIVDCQNDTRRRVFGNVIRSVWDGKDRFHSGDTVNRLEEDIRVVCDFICSSLPDMFITAVQLIAASAYLFIMSPGLAWILIWIMPVAVVGSRLFFRRLRRLTNEIRAQDSEIQGHMQENIQNKILVRTMGNTAGVQNKLEDMQGNLRRKNISRMNYSAVARFFMHAGFASGYALAFLWGVFGLRDGTVTYGLMVAFLQLVGQIQRPVANLSSQVPAFIRALSSEDRILDLTGLEQEEEGEEIIFSSAPGVKVDSVSFSYPDAREPVLENFSHDFKPGTMTAILGLTGAGKSTLIKLILALLKPSSGKIELYDSTREVESCVDTRCNFMYVPQGNSLMSGTIRQNLLMADPKATESQMKDVLETAAAGFVLDMPLGLDTPCEEVGRGLSEGQAQRIAIARALLRPGGILVLDECTSALDAETEGELLRKIQNKYRGTKTILCITHRPAAVDYADEVLKIS